MRFTRYSAIKAKNLYTTLAVSAIFLLAAYYYSVQEKTPVFIPDNIPPIEAYQASVFDYADISDVTEKKQIFFSTLRPIVEHQNLFIRNKRQRILFAQQNDTDHQWVHEVAADYNIEWDNETPDWDQLLFHIDTIPFELVLTQAANESAWGTSRFAQKGNNLFGQWCFKKGCGIVPVQRDSGSKHEVKKFKSINASVASYMRNINTTRAYDKLREMRKILRTENKPLNAMTLATGLEKYSSRGILYVKEIQSMIKTNLPLMRDISRSK